MPSHRITEDWMGEPVETLEDLLRPGLRAVCVGINPSLVSVDVGHYYQGRAGQRFLGRLVECGLIPSAPKGSEDDAAFEAGVGFTDVVKRPSSGAKDLRSADYDFGRERLLARLLGNHPRLVVFTYKTGAVKLFGKNFEGHGFVRGLSIGESAVFLMPGPYEKRQRARPSLNALAEWAERN